MSATRVVDRTESLTTVTVYYTADGGKDRRKKFPLRSAADRFLEKTPTAYRVDVESTSLTWLKPVDAAAEAPAELVAE